MKFAIVVNFCYYFSMKQVELKNVVWKEGKYFVAQCLNVDVSSFGKNRKEALKNLDEALELYFQDDHTVHITKVERPEIVRFSLGHV